MVFPLGGLGERQVFSWEQQPGSGQQLGTPPCSTQPSTVGWKHCLVEGAKWLCRQVHSLWHANVLGFGLSRGEIFFMYLFQLALPSCFLFLSWPLSYLCLGDEHDTSISSLQCCGGRWCLLMFWSSQKREGEEEGGKRNLCSIGMNRFPCVSPGALSGRRLVPGARLAAGGSCCH